MSNRSAAKVVIASAWFWPVSVAFYALSHVFDLWGTYVHQPHFEFEANPIYRALDRMGMAPSWPVVIGAKLVLIAIGACCASIFVEKRRNYFPASGHGFREFITIYFYGRPLQWLQTFYRLPRRWGATWVLIAGMVPLTSPALFYAGYSNFAHHFRLPDIGHWHIFGTAVPPVVIIVTVGSMAWLSWQIWLEYSTPP